jgi:hypothetical protein
LLSPSFVAIALDDFHAVALTALPFALALVLAVAGCRSSASLLVLAAALMEEEAALAAIGLGLLLLARGARRFGAGLLGGGAVLLALAALVIMPAFHHPATLHPEAGTRSASHFAVLRAQPDILADRLLGSRGWDALVAFVLPTGGLSLLSPTTLLAGLPTLAALFLQDRDDTFTRHWAAPIMPVMWIATVAGLARMPPPRRRAALCLLFLGAVVAYRLASPLPGGAAFVPDELARGPRERALGRAVTLVPPDVPSVVSANVAAHLAHRHELFVYPIDDHYAAALGYAHRDAEAYVLDLTDPATQRVQPLSGASPLMANPPFIVQSTAHKLLVLTRSAPPPQHQLDLLYGRGMAFRGYDLSSSDDVLRITFHWQRTGVIAADFRRVVEVLDASGSVLVQDQDLELTRTLATQKWQVGQQVRDEVELGIPADSRFGLKIRVQWQNRDQRRPILLQDGSPSVEIAI